MAGFVSYGEAGQGQYSKDNYSSHSTAEIATSYVIRALENLNYDPSCGRPFTVCEFGAADGLTSLNVMTKIIEYVRGKCGKDIPIAIIYEDLPTTDFKSLFLALSGNLHAPFNSFQVIYQNVYVFATGRDFYHQCLPNSSLHFAYSSTAMHYLGQRPCQLQDAIQVVESSNPQEKAMFAAQAAKDWYTILLHRAQELVPGGQIVLCVPCIDHLGQYPGKTLRNNKARLHDYLARPWKDMMQEGLICQGDFAEMSFNSYYRSPEEYTAPFRDQTSAVYRSGLRLVALETQVTSCPVQTEWLKQENKDDVSCRKAFTKKAVAQIRSWSHWLFVQVLAKNRPDESAALVDEFWQRYEELVAANLDIIHCDIPFAYLWIEKIRNT